MLEEISGNRCNYAIPTIGGVRRDLQKDKFPKWHKMLDTLAERTNYYIKVASTEQTILDRAVGVGYVGKEDMIRLSGSGPNARSSGVPCDTRKTAPYLLYDEIPFEHIYVDNGDVLGQVLVRVLETLEAVKICKWVLDNIPDGEIAVKFNPMQKVPEGEAVYIVEAQRGELIHYTISDGRNMPYRHKIRAPTLGNIPSLVERLKGGYIADIPITLAGIDPCFSCTDRMVFYDEGKDKTWVWDEEQLRRHGLEWYKK